MPTPAKYFGTNRKFVNRTRFDPKLILAHELFHALQLSNNETDVPFPSLLKPILGNDSFFDKEIDIEAAAIRFTNNIRIESGGEFIRLRHGTAPFNPSRKGFDDDFADADQRVKDTLRKYGVK